jgi:acyl-coenzyme A thioesterase PaaI-like protein
MDTSMGTNASTESAALKDSHQACFACGAGNPTGLNLHFDTDSAGGVLAVWLPTAAFQSYPDRVHGGVISTLLDGAMVHALFARGIAGVTAELTIRYLQSVNVRDAVHIHGSVERHRHGVYLCRAEAHQAGRLAVRASAKFMALPE